MHPVYKKFTLSTTALIGSIPVLGTVSLPAYAQYSVGAGEDYAVTSGTTIAGAEIDGVAGGSITNSGSIIEGTYGITLFNNPADLTGGIINNAGGLISGGTNGILVAPVAQVSGGITNNNSATIYGGTNAIQVNGYGSISGNIDNAGAITGGDKGISTIGFSQISGDINNTGSITGTTSGIHFFGSTVNGNINNNVGGLISGGETGIWVESMNMGGAINNSGTIRGYDDGSPATSGAIYINSGRVIGGITNSGVIDGQGNTAINMVGLSGLNAITFNGGRVIGDIIDDTPTNNRSSINITGDFSTEGNVTVSDLTVAAGQRFTITPSNAVTLNDMSASTGTFSFGIHADMLSSRLIVTNGDVDLTGATVRAARITGKLSEGDAIILADGNAAVTGGPGATPTSIADSSALWNFQLVDGTYGAIGGDSSQLYTLVSYGENGRISDIGSSENNKNVGSVLDAINGTSDPVLSSIMNNINNASSQEEINNIIDSVNITPNRALVTTSQTLTAQTQNIVSQRLSSQRTGVSVGEAAQDSFMGFKGFSAFNGFQGFKGFKGFNIGLDGSDFGLDDLSVWGQAYNSTAKQGARDNISGYDADTTGFAMGAETTDFHDNMVVGGSVSYSQTDVDSRDGNQTSIDIDSYQLAIYGDYDLDENLFVKGSVGYVHNENETKRSNIGGVDGLTADGEFASDYYFSEVEIGYDYQHQEDFLTPALTLFYGHHESDDYIETGAGGVNLAVNSDSLDILELGAKLDASWKYEVDNGTIIEPRIHVGYKYDLIGEAISSTSRFTGDGTTFTSTGAKPARSTFNFGAGLNHYLTDSWSYKLGYDLIYKDDYIAHSMLLKAKYEF